MVRVGQSLAVIMGRRNSLYPGVTAVALSGSRLAISYMAYDG